MIKADQPTIFPANLRVLFTSVSDGSMSDINKKGEEFSYQKQRQMILKNNNFDSTKSSTILINYDSDSTFRKIRRIDTTNAGTDQKADAFYTTEAGIPLLLKVADCIATLIYDPKVGMIGLLHLGRHSSTAHLIEAFFNEVSAKTGSKAEDWQVWMSAGLKQPNHKLHFFDPQSPDEWRNFTKQQGQWILVDMYGHNQHRFELLGVLPKNIQISPIDTFSNVDYFSHRAATELNQPNRQGRMMVAAMLDTTA